MIPWRNRKETQARRTPDETAGASDVDLVQAARRGDKRAFVEIVARHQAMVCGIALAILGDFASSEDAAQEAFLTAWRKFHDLREPERLRAWLAQIARNAALGHLRRQRGHEALEDGLGLVDALPTPDEAAAGEEEAAIVRESLAKLPETYRLPLVLYYREGQSVRAVAEALDISEDAAKQRLARGREMLRERMSGLIETVLKRSGPTAVFTMTIAAAIGALAAPAAVAGGVFSAAAVAAGSSTSGPLLTFMSTSKTVLITAAVVAVACIPVGYHFATDRQLTPETKPTPAPMVAASLPDTNAPPGYESSALFAEWRALHDQYGRTREAMPLIYQAINGLQDPFRKQMFRAALISEWVQLDPAGGLAFFTGKGPDARQRKQFMEEALANDARATIDALINASGLNWESMARENLPEIARRAPGRVPEIAARLSKAESLWDTNVRDAFAIIAETDFNSARAAAEALSGPNRDQALAGVARVWGKTDLDATVAWARKLPDGSDRDEIIRAALLGKATVDPVAALENSVVVPSGHKWAMANSSTGARILVEAAKSDFDGTVAWLTANPGRLGREDLMGLSGAVTDRMNADAVGFLTTYAAKGSLQALLPAVESSLLNNAGGQRAAVWEWLKTQPETEATKQLYKRVLSSAAWQDQALAMRLAEELPRTAEGDAQMKELARCLFNGGNALYRFDRLMPEVPDRLRQPLIEEAFGCLYGNMGDPQPWIARLPQLPEASRAKGIASIAGAWAGQSPEDAINWVRSLTPGDGRTGAAAAVVTSWARTDARSAADWVAAMPSGAERDRSAGSLVVAISERFPREAWQWALSINDGDERTKAATHAAKMMAAKDPVMARQWIEAGPFTPETKVNLQAVVEKAVRSPGIR